MEQAIIAVGQGHYPETDSDDSSYPVNIQIKTNYPHPSYSSDSGDITDESPTIFTGYIWGFNNYGPNSITVFFYNEGNQREGDCLSSTTLQAVNKGIYNIESWAGFDISVYEIDYGSSKPIEIASVNREKFSEVDYLYNNMYYPYLSEFNKAVENSINPNWDRYFKSFTKDYSVMEAKISSIAVEGNGDSGMILPDSPLSVSISKGKYTGKFHLTDPTDTFSSSDIIANTLEERNDATYHVHSHIVLLTNLLREELYSGVEFVHHQINDVYLNKYGYDKFINPDSFGTQNYGGYTDEGKTLSATSLCRHEILLSTGSGPNILVGPGLHRSLPDEPDNYPITIIATENDRQSYMSSFDFSSYMGSFATKCYGAMAVLSL